MKAGRKTGLLRKHGGARYRQLLESMPEGYQVIDRNWRYRYVNNAAAGHAGKKKKELLGRILMDVYPGIENTEFFNTLKRCIQKQIVHEMENKVTYPDGSIAWLSLHIQPVPEGVSVLSIDITIRKLAEIKTKNLYAVFKKRVAGRTALIFKHYINNSLLSIAKNSPASIHRTAKTGFWQ